MEPLNARVKKTAVWMVRVCPVPACLCVWGLRCCLDVRHRGTAGG